MVAVVTPAVAALLSPAASLPSLFFFLVFLAFSEAVVSLFLVGFSLLATIKSVSFLVVVGGVLCVRLFGRLLEFECVCCFSLRLASDVLFCATFGVVVALLRFCCVRLVLVVVFLLVVLFLLFSSLLVCIALLLDLFFLGIDRVLFLGHLMVCEPGLTCLTSLLLVFLDAFLLGGVVLV